MTFPPASSQGTVLAARDGGVFTYGTAPFAGSMGGQHLNAPIVGVATAPDGQGYWLVGSDGGCSRSVTRCSMAPWAAST